MTCRVAILLSTYDGERFVEEQLDSLLRQTHVELVVHVRDDGSSDATLSIVERCARADARIVVVRDGRGNLGAANSFLALLSTVDAADYVMFCDQDDVWFPEKVARFVERVRQVEARHARGTPVLVFGDMIVTDEHLRPIAQSFWAHRRLLMDDYQDWRTLMFANPVAGCSAILNMPAVQLLDDFGPSPVLHDLLAAVLMARHGVVETLPTPTMHYRQHDSNVEGASRYGVGLLAARTIRFATASVPKYVALCRALSVPLWHAAWLKASTVLRRLL